jgi:hypothetical protein
MIDKLERIWKETVVAIEVLSQRCPGDTEEPGIASVKIIGIPLEIRTEGLANAIGEIYLYSNH